jgi:hypothetical protein
MAGNKYAGEQAVTIDGKVYFLVFNWGAIGEIQSTLGEEKLVKIGKIGALSPDEIATVLEIGFKAKHPEMTKEAIMNASPVIVEVLFAIDQALSCAYFGPTNKADKDAEKTVDKQAKGTKKKT